MRKVQLLAALLCAGVTSGHAMADDLAADEWRFGMTTYLWTPAVNGDTTVKGVKTSVDATFIDIVQEADSIFAYNGQFEAGKGDFTLQFNPTYMKIGAKDDVTSGGPMNTKIDADVEITYLELVALYRIGTWPVGYNAGQDQTLSIEPFAGVRYTRLHGDLDIKFTALNTKTSVDGTEDWFDPIVGARSVLKLTDSINFGLRGDVGGFGVGSDFSWQVVGGLDHRFGLFGHEARAFAGYRALYQDYEDGSGANKFEWDMTLHGPILGMTVNF
ncbi:MAG: hypothetical protein R3245_04805 [Kiloniellales bacterium]|nr:hypothetical protein [Kiloniellales bacterium]